MHYISPTDGGNTVLLAQRCTTSKPRTYRLSSFVAPWLMYYNTAVKTMGSCWLSCCSQPRFGAIAIEIEPKYSCNSINYWDLILSAELLKIFFFFFLKRTMQSQLLIFCTILSSATQSTLFWKGEKVWNKNISLLLTSKHKQQMKTQTHTHLQNSCNGSQSSHSRHFHGPSVSPLLLKVAIQSHQKQIAWLHPHPFWLLSPAISAKPSQYKISNNIVWASNSLHWLSRGESTSK